MFSEGADYAAFEKALSEAYQASGMRLLSSCLMPNRWQLVLWLERAGQLSLYMQWVTTTHVRRWHTQRGTAGTGPLDQGRFKSFPVQKARKSRWCRLGGGRCPPCRWSEMRGGRSWCGRRRTGGDAVCGSAGQAERPDWLLEMKRWPSQSCWSDDVPRATNDLRPRDR